MANEALLSLKKLIENRYKLGFKRTRDTKVKLVSMKPVLQNKSLVIKAQALGSKLYPVTLILYGMELKNEQSASHPVRVEDEKGVVRWTNQFDENTTKVSSRCSCDDYYFTWSYANNKSGNLAGPKMRPYIRKTSTYPPRNPDLIPGCCKHVEDLARRLKKEKIIK